MPVIRAGPDVASAAFIQTGIDFQFRGRAVSGFAFSPVQGTFAASMLTGRAPAGAGEVALGARTATELGAAPGTRLSGRAENDSAPQVPVLVTGTVVLPPGDANAHLGDGVLVSRPALLRLAGGQARSPYVIAVTFRPGLDVTQAGARLDRRLSAADPDFFTLPPATPAGLVNFGQIQNLPVILGSLLAVVALLTVAHLLASTVRQRRRDLAILKMIGFTRAELARIVAWQAATVAVVALVFAVPFGIIAGRLSWRLFAERLGGIPVPETSAAPLILVAAAALVLAILAAAGPAVTALRTRPASVLREE